MVVFGPCFALCRAYNVSQYAAWIFGWVHWNHAGCLFGWLPFVAADVVEITSVHLNLNSDIISGLLNIECWILLNSTKFRDVFKLISICMHVCMHGLCYDFPISIELSVKAPTATITPRQWPPWPYVYTSSKAIAAATCNHSPFNSIQSFEQQYRVRG